MRHGQRDCRFIFRCRTKEDETEQCCRLELTSGAQHRSSSQQSSTRSNRTLDPTRTLLDAKVDTASVCELSPHMQLFQFG